MTKLSRPQASKRQRRLFFQEFVRRINYEPLPLLPDTVTEVILEKDTAGTATNLEIGLVGTSGTIEDLNISLKYKIREDPLRVVYPASTEYPFFRKINDKELSRDSEISDGVFRVYNNLGLQGIRKELENLEYFADVPGIVQAEGVAVSTNPYMISRASNGLLVVTGILLRAYPGGSLQEILQKIAKKTHMDIKPSNIVIDSGGNAVIIDISGISGITHEWCSPEIQGEVSSPFDLSFEKRRSNDVWAYGKLLSWIGSHVSVRDDPVANSLKQVAECLMEDNCQSRMGLSGAISRLSEGLWLHPDGQ
ncbi:protein kinase domain protein [Penicillium waksmanii]|uniref:protein kinase domain protein n=1 Tax=Penicillium waksmanii TaxID=69791 RepID=UPI00254976BB|nr:protein kinase domain protein [Penicillium waksmanii]KAJ5974401.1 protein kinase domain protein [Penicillium waksmanii]